MTKAPYYHDLTKTVLALLLLAILISSSFWIMKPFFPAIIWGGMIVISTWQVMLKIQSKVGGRRWLAMLIMLFLLISLLIIPMALVITSLVEMFQELFVSGNLLTEMKIPQPPEWLGTVPVVGSKLVVGWKEYARLNAADIYSKVSPHLNSIISWFLSQAGSLGMVLMHSFLTVVVAAVSYMHGETAAKGITLFARRVAGRAGEDAVMHAAKAVKGVAVGVVGTSLIQALLGAGGLLVAGINGVGLLASLIFLSSISPGGPSLILLPVTGWLFMNDQIGMAIFMAIWTIVVSNIDSVIRPILIKTGGDFPFLLIFVGVIGGLLSFGVTGLFIGPVMLAVTYSLLVQWVVEKEADEDSG
ncbi:MAG: AI-2E family transporter YdiK [Geobacteraceae bacterium]|nr:AI-2E family transporter YdiK [Geobacteraceae bacterium]